MNTAGHGDSPVDVLLRDGFADPVRRGHVVGSRIVGGCDGDVWRGGVDAERVLSVDGEGLRIQPLARPGWGRAGVAYRSFAPKPGRAAVFEVLNGHHGSQVHPSRPLLRQIVRWLVGSGSLPFHVRLVRWARQQPRVSRVRRLRCWWLAARRPGAAEPLMDNLATGWFRDAAPQDPRAGAFSFVVTATEATNGSLGVSIGGRSLCVAPEIHNVAATFVVVLRERGALYLAAGPAGSVLGCAPGRLVPLAIDPGGTASPGDSLVPGVHQAVLGEIGFGMDTRVRAVTVVDVADLDQWYTTAAVADRLTGEGSLADSPTVSGARWFGDPSVVRTAEGLIDADSGSAGREQPGGPVHGVRGAFVAMPAGEEPVGLVHLLVATGAAPGLFGLLLSEGADGRYWQLDFGRSEASAGAATVVVGAGADGDSAACPIARADVARLAPGRVHALGVRLARTALHVACDGEELLVAPLPADARVNVVGIAGAGTWGTIQLRDLEVHPRSVAVPPILAPPVPDVAPPLRVVLQDGWECAAGDLDGVACGMDPALRWRRSWGSGRFVPDGDGVRVDASVARPTPGRTIYTVPWSDAGYAELAVTVTPPGTRRGQGHNGRAGVAFWQDEGTHLLVNTWLDDGFAGSSVSCFAVVDGFEDVFDAVWVNVGGRIRWGHPYELRVRFDGSAWGVYVDGLAVCFRRLADINPVWERMAIRRVGLVANWEWGNDTGSRFRDFQASARK